VNPGGQGGAARFGGGLKATAVAQDEGGAGLEFALP
jgi:hypothetical protein